MLPVSLEIREGLNRIRNHLAGDIDRFLTKKLGEGFEIKQFTVIDHNNKPLNLRDRHYDYFNTQRFIKFIVDGVTYRFNYESKEDFLDRNDYWMMNLPYPRNYRICIKHIY